MSVLIADVRALDTLDDRREVWWLLHKLPPGDRYRFLAWCCRQVYLPNSRIHPTPSWLRMGPRIRAAAAGDDAQDRALTNEIDMDLFMMAMSYSLDTRAAAVTLEAWVRRRR